MYIDSTGRIVVSDELYHHGVRGQQWGVRNGDYYPLLPSQHSSSEKRAGWRKSLEGGNARSSKTSFGEMYKTASNANAARKAGTSGGSSSSSSSESSSTSSSGGGAYAAMRDELIAKTKERLANSTATTDSGTKKSTKGSTGKASSGGRSGKSGGKSSDDASNDQNIIELKEELKKMREELEANTESLTSGSEEEEIDDGKTLNVDAEELVKESVDVNKYKETVENLLKDNEPEEVRRLIEKELLDDESGSYKELDDEVKEYLLDMVDKIIDENKSNKKSLTHYCIDNRGYLVSYEEDCGLALYHHGILGMEHGKRNGPPYPLARGDHSAAERKAGWTKSLENIAKATGKGVARAARATGRGIKATGKGVASAAKATKKGLIRVNLYPKKLMSDQDILDKVERLKKEDLLKHAKGKLTNEDKAAQKLKNRDAAREVVKQTLIQLLPSIGKDLVIAKIKGNFELQKKWDDKVREDIYEDARASGMSATDARKAADAGDVSIAPRSKDNKQKGGKNQFDLENSVKQDIYNAAKKAGYTPTEAAKLAESGDDSSLKGRISNESTGKKQTESSGSSGKSKGETKSETPSAPTKTKQASNNDNQSDDKLDKDLVKKAQGAIYDEWIKSGASPAQAAKAASRMDDNVGTWKEAREKKAVTEAANAKRRETVRKNKEAAEKAAQEAAFKKKIIDARQSYIDKRKEEAKDRVQEIGGTILGYRNGKVLYRDSKGNQREKDYVDAALRDFGNTLIADKPTAYNQIKGKPTRLR